MRGIDPRTSRMLKRSTIWATSPLRKRGAIALCNLPSFIEIVEQSPILHIVANIGFVDASLQSMCFSYANRLAIPIDMPERSKRSCLCQTDVFDSLISIVTFLRRLFLLVIRDTNRFLSKLCTVSDASFPYWTYKSMSSSGLTKQLTVFLFLISGLLWKIGDAGHRSPYLSHAKRALYHELHPRWGNGELLPYRTFPLLSKYVNRVLYCLSL